MTLTCDQWEDDEEEEALHHSAFSDRLTPAPYFCFLLSVCVGSVSKCCVSWIPLLNCPKNSCQHFSLCPSPFYLWILITSCFTLLRLGIDGKQETSGVKRKTPWVTGKSLNHYVRNDRIVKLYFEWHHSWEMCFTIRYTMCTEYFTWTCR